jgi:hypothetical protein
VVLTVFFLLSCLENLGQLFGVSAIPEWRAVDSTIDAIGILALGYTMLLPAFADTEERYRCRWSVVYANPVLAGS